MSFALASRSPFLMRWASETSSAAESGVEDATSSRYLWRESLTPAKLDRVARATGCHLDFVIWPNADGFIRVRLEARSIKGISNVCQALVLI
jgi:hypothetical protein